jgi:hypothetical protein
MLGLSGKMGEEKRQRQKRPRGRGGRGKVEDTQPKKQRHKALQEAAAQ